MIENVSFEILEKGLYENNQTNSVVLHGPPGIGKTSNALNFAYQLTENSDWIVLWFNSDTKDKFLIDLQSFFKNLKSEQNGQNKTFEHLVNEIKSEFRRNERKKFLIVLDNLNDFEWIESFFTSLPKNVFIIATSTKINVLDNISATKILIEYFDESQARKFFEKKYDKKKKAIVK